MEWRNDYRKFRDWSLENGYREGLDLCREKVKLDYTPENCYFAKKSHNTKHRSNTKMTWESVRNIRQLYNDGSMSQDQLGEKFKICPSTVSRIVNNKLWVEDNMINHIL